jgi:hypothetical protein
MDDSSSAGAELQMVVRSIRDHLLQAQELMDSMNPNSIFGARVQQLIDELDEHTLRDVRRMRQSNAID